MRLAQVKSFVVFPTIKSSPFWNVREWNSHKCFRYQQLSMEKKCIPISQFQQQKVLNIPVLWVYESLSQSHKIHNRLKPLISIHNFPWKARSKKKKKTIFQYFLTNNFRLACMMNFVLQFSLIVNLKSHR